MQHGEGWTVMCWLTIFLFVMGALFMLNIPKDLVVQARRHGAARAWAVHATGGVETTVSTVACGTKRE